MMLLSIDRSNNKSVIDLTGKQYGFLSVLGRTETPPTHSNNGMAFWLVECQCGQRKSVAGIGLRKGYTRTCGSRECRKKYGYSLTSDKSVVFKILSRVYRKRAKEKSVVFTIADSFMWKLFESACFYCGDPPREIQRGHYSAHAHGIDRLDSSIGYEEYNIVACCWSCNKAKSEMSVEDFSAHIEKIYLHFCLPRKEIRTCC